MFRKWNVSVALGLKQLMYIGATEEYKRWKHADCKREDERERENMETQRQPESVCSQSWSIAVEGGAMPSGIAEGVVDSGPAWFNNTHQRIVIQNNNVRGQRWLVGRAR